MQNKLYKKSQTHLYYNIILYLWKMIDQNRLRAKANKKIVTQEDLVLSITDLGYKMDGPRFSRWLLGDNVSDNTAKKIQEGIKKLKK